ncbi:MAG: EVE domain-containing protein [Deltaproteobacteria bacterium]|nr:MAG: EVE domain-containing protein [Deltaproteobacteria bacterium]
MPRRRRYWLAKSEPFKYSWSDFEKDGSTYWDGVRNAQARNSLAEMKKSDLVLFYHSNEGKEVVGIAKVTKESYPDPTTDDERWVVVELAPLKAMKEPVTLQQIKSDPELAETALIKQSRLSVMPLSKPAFDRILELGGTQV